jgi:hypothetical protein
MATVGEIVGILRLDPSEWDRTIEHAKAKSAELAAKSPKITVQVDAITALSKLEAVRAAALRVEAAEARLGELRGKEGVKTATLRSAEAGLISARIAAAKAASDYAVNEEKVNRSLDQTVRRLGPAGRGLRTLVATALLLGPALVPVAAVLGGMFVGLAPMLGVAVLGFAAIKQEMKDGTPLGLKYKQVFSGITSEFTQMKLIASSGLFSGIQSGVSSLSAGFAPLNSVIAMVAHQLGAIIANVAPALVAMFSHITPLIQTFGDALVRGSAEFKNWAESSTGVQRFVAYVEAQMPTVMGTLGNLASAIAKVVTALAPWGGVVLVGLRLFAQILNNLPLGVLTALIPLIVGGTTAVKLFQGAMRFAARAGIDWAASLRVVVPSALAVGAALMVVTTIMARQQAAAAAQRGMLDSLTQSLVESKGAIDAQVTSLIGQQLQALNADTNAQKLGLSLTTLTQAAMGNKRAMDQVKEATGDSLTAHGGLLLVVEGEANQFANAKDKAKAYADMQKTLTDNAQTFTAAQIAAAAGLGVSTQKYVDAKGAIEKNKDALAATTLQMQIQNDVLGLLNQSYDTFMGKNLGAAEASTRLAGDMIALTESLKKNKSAIGSNTQAGVDNQKAIEAVIEDLRSQSQALAGSGKSQDQVTAAYNKGRTALLNQLAALYGTKSEIYKFAAANSAAAPVVESHATSVKHLQDKIDKLKSKQVHMSEEGAYAAGQEIARLQRKLDALQGKTVPVNVITHFITVGHPVGTQGKLATAASGGLITGPGTGTSDSITMRVSKGEYIMPADVTAKYLPQLRAMRAGTSTLPSGGGMRAGGMWDGGDTYIVNQYIAGSVVTENELHNKSIAEIDRRRRRVGLTGITDSHDAALKGVTLNTDAVIQ